MKVCGQVAVEERVCIDNEEAVKHLQEPQPSEEVSAEALASDIREPQGSPMDEGKFQRCTTEHNPRRRTC